MRCSSPASTSVAPVARAVKISKTDTSKVTAAKPSSRVSASTAYARAMSATKVPTAPRGTTVPLGVPVEPDVYRTYAGCSGRGGATRSASVTGAGAYPARPARSGACTGTSVPASPSRTAEAAAVSVRSRAGTASESVYARRAGGLVGSRGR